MLGNSKHYEDLFMKSKYLPVLYLAFYIAAAPYAKAENIKIEWGQLKEDFSVSNPSDGSGKCGLESPMGSVYKYDKGITFEVKSKTDSMTAFNGYVAFFYDNEGVEIDHRNVIVESKYGAKWKTGMPGRGCIDLNKIPISSVSTIKIREL